MSCQKRMPQSWRRRRISRSGPAELRRPHHGQLATAEASLLLQPLLLQPLLLPHFADVAAATAAAVRRRRRRRGKRE